MIDDHRTTVFPLLQSVVTINDQAVKTDAAAMNGGATLAFAANGGPIDEVALDVPGDQLSNVALTAGGFYCYSLCGQIGSNSVTVELAEPADDLSWTSYGFWDSLDARSETVATFVTGYKTADSNVPTSGSATYNGSVVGKVIFPDAGAHGVGVYYLNGDVSLAANFGSGSITGNLTNMTSGQGPWNSVSLLGSISGSQNAFSGTSAATSAPANAAAMSGSASGTFAGMFFGPSAQELGAVWTLFDGSSTATGSFGAKTGP
ncbi:MAG: transferrin-binding protein-like solute binding protein [Vicinamibacterales bacterium]